MKRGRGDKTVRREREGGEGGDEKRDERQGKTVVAR